jgi:hypothetical protein
MAGAMIPPEVLNSKSLFTLLYKIDQDLSDQTRARGCPSAGVLCIAPITCENLEVGPLILKRPLRFASACAAAGRVAGAVCCRHRCVFGAAGSTGRRCCCWLVLCAKGTQSLPLSDSRPCAACGDPPSTVGRSISVISLPRASATGVCSVT